MGWLTWIKIGGAVVLLLGGSFLIWNYQHMKTKIAAQELVIQEQQQAIKFYEKANEIDVETKATQEEFKKVVESADPQKIKDYFDKMRERTRKAMGE